VHYKTALFFVARFLLPFSALAYFNTRLILTDKIVIKSSTTWLQA